MAAFRAALQAWPGAQSARVALMTLLVVRGNREEAAALAEAGAGRADRPVRSVVDVLAGRLPDLSGDPRQSCGSWGDEGRSTSAAVLAPGATVLMAVAVRRRCRPAPQSSRAVFRTGADVVSVDASVQRDGGP